jgi:hypothetical protein
MNTLQNIITYVSFILALYFTASILCRAYILGKSVQHNVRTATPPITTLRLLLWAFCTGNFIVFQFLVK